MAAAVGGVQTLGVEEEVRTVHPTYTKGEPRGPKRRSMATFSRFRIELILVFLLRTENDFGASHTTDAVPGDGWRRDSAHNGT
jgi:hypothetical protein